MSGSEWGQLPNASSGMRYILIRASRYKMYRPLTLLFGKVFFRIHFALGLEGLPVPIERKSRLDPCLVGLLMGLSSLWPLSSIEMYFSLVPSMDAALTWLTLAARLAATSSEASSGLLISCVDWLH